MRRPSGFLSRRFVCGLILTCVSGTLPARCQEPAPPVAKPAQQLTEASEKVPELPAQIELLETRVRFEANGDSRKEVHTRVHINNELGVRQFARLAFDYNRSFQQIEFPLVRITHSGGGTVDILPSAISDQPNPVVVNAPAYQDVRVKSVRILGLTPNDVLEYRVVTTTSRHPLAPDFWLDHTFDRSGVVSHEVFELDLPASGPRMEISPQTPVTNAEKAGTRAVYRWDLRGEKAPARDFSDVAITTFPSWDVLAQRLESKLRSTANTASAAQKTVSELAGKSATDDERIRILYEFVSHKIATVNLPLGSSGFQPRTPNDILASGYATAEDKYVLFRSLVAGLLAAMTGSFEKLSDQLPRPSLLSHLVVITSIAFLDVGCTDCAHMVWLDPSLEVAPFGMLAAGVRSKEAIGDKELLFQLPGPFMHVPDDLPFHSTQKVVIYASLGLDGTLTAKAKYIVRGDNELLLRVAFHQAPKEKWKEVAQLLALSDGFRGKVTNVTASDPYATKEPFTVEYEITQPKFVDWSKKPVRIPALLPQVGLPDPPAKAASGGARSSIELGTPLDVETHLTLRLPKGTVVRTPTGTSVERDYAAFASKYQASSGAVTASRHLNFLLREISADRSTDYNVFVRAVQSDEAQEFTLEQAGTEPSKQAASGASNPKKN